MPHIERVAHVGWDGNLARGAGTLDAVSGSFARLPFSLASRVGDPGGKTSPEELLAAAHGGCLTMSLAGEPTSAGTPPRRLDVACTIVMDEVEGQGHQIVGSRVEIVARVDGADDAAKLICYSGEPSDTNLAGTPVSGWQTYDGGIFVAESRRALPHGIQ